LSEILPVASLCVILAQLNLTKLELEYLKSDFKCKEESTDKNFCIYRVRFSSSAQVCFENTAVRIHLVYKKFPVVISPRDSDKYVFLCSIVRYGLG